MRGPLIYPDPRNASILGKTSRLGLAEGDQEYKVVVSEVLSDGTVGRSQEFRGSPPFIEIDRLEPGSSYQFAIEVEGDPLSIRKYSFRVMSVREEGQYWRLVEVAFRGCPPSEYVLSQAPRPGENAGPAGTVSPKDLELIAGALLELGRYGDVLDLLNRCPMLFGSDNERRREGLQDRISILRSLGRS